MRELEKGEWRTSLPLDRALCRNNSLFYSPISWNLYSSEVTVTMFTVHRSTVQRVRVYARTYLFPFRLVSGRAQLPWRLTVWLLCALFWSKKNEIRFAMTTWMRRRKKETNHGNRFQSKWSYSMAATIRITFDGATLTFQNDSVSFVFFFFCICQFSFVHWLQVRTYYCTYYYTSLPRIIWRLHVN